MSETQIKSSHNENGREAWLEVTIESFCGSLNWSRSFITLSSCRMMGLLMGEELETVQYLSRNGLFWLRLKASENFQNKSSSELLSSVPNLHLAAKTLQTQKVPEKRTRNQWKKLCNYEKQLNKLKLILWPIVKILFFPSRLFSVTCTCGVRIQSQHILFGFILCSPRN